MSTDFRPLTPIPMAGLEQRRIYDEIGLGDLNLDDREAALGINRHQVGAPPVRQRHLANSEQVLATEQTCHAARNLGSERRRFLLQL